MSIITLSGLRPSSSPLPFTPAPGAARGMAWNAPFPKQRVNFTCRGGVCYPTDAYSEKILAAVNRYLGIHTPASYGLTGWHVSEIQRLVLSGELLLMRPLQTPADAASHLHKILAALARRQSAMPMRLPTAFPGEPGLGAAGAPAASSGVKERPPGKKAPPKKKDRPTAGERPGSAMKTAQPVKGRVEGFDCLKGLCKPAYPSARQAAVNLQNVLNQFPPAFVARYNRGKPLKPDGIIGKDTAAAVNAVIAINAARKGLRAAALGFDAEWIAANLGEISSDIQKIQAGVEKETPPAPGEVETVPAMPSKNVYASTPKGAIAGNRRFRCMAMGLQVQLNRLGQRLVADGVIGPNTLASVNKVLGGALTAKALAADIDNIVSQVRKKADLAKAPAPPKNVGGVAYAKCLTETSQPQTDARLAEPKGGEKPIIAKTETSKAPTPEATPAAKQPPPPRVDRRAPRRAFIPPAEGVPAPGGEAATSPPPSETTPPPPSPVTAEQAQQMVEQAVAAGLSPDAATSIARAGVVDNAPAEVVAAELQRKLTEQAQAAAAGGEAAPEGESKIPWKWIAIGTGAFVGVTALGYGIYRIARGHRAPAVAGW